MESYGSGSRPYGADRRMEIVSGKNTSVVASNQIPPVPARTSQASTNSKPWGFTDPEMKRKKRIAKYKVYTVEGKMKATLGKGFRWIKNKCSQIVRGY
ncbi:hypothetical protein F3Y22_tig00111983pilonHSYRG00104 [Hibiscus syriacus]|uniref:DUF3511 domain protein n=1 Tax=Hibiscus syriacus TaxID=106335 RepID=A0A6A2YEI1_HIBSY|nr:uncharacterized protein LOC120173780 [Hibiscus syriacus]KAE8671274.1 hypothetical protein F3Y22_tig00111983pilonHSYRG00104 [Hibiscus syriacus]